MHLIIVCKVRRRSIFTLQNYASYNFVTWIAGTKMQPDFLGKNFRVWVPLLCLKVAGGHTHQKNLAVTYTNSYCLQCTIKYMVWSNTWHHGTQWLYPEFPECREITNSRYQALFSNLLICWWGGLTIDKYCVYQWYYNVQLKSGGGQPCLRDKRASALSTKFCTDQEPKKLSGLWNSGLFAFCYNVWLSMGMCFAPKSNVC